MEPVFPKPLASHLFQILVAAIPSRIYCLLASACGSRTMGVVLYRLRSPVVPR